jgi:WXXGXW repeat (2 copies)
MKLNRIALVALLFAGLPLASSSAQVGVSITVAPPVLPVIEQPPCPVEGYLWTPGYWGYSDVGYYWTPGVWVEPPQVGLLWTPPYWGYSNGVYAFNDGYWGPNIGFYGGVNYGFGYFGSGYYGGRWDGNIFRYNTAVTRVNTSVIHNTFADRTVLSKQTNRSRASFNGANGVKAEATAEEKAAANAQHVAATAKQTSVREAASKNRDLQASVNKGHPKGAAIEAVRKSAEPAGPSQQGKAASEKSSNNAQNATNAEKRNAAEKKGKGETGANAANASKKEGEEAGSAKGEHAGTHSANAHAAAGPTHRASHETGQQENATAVHHGPNTARIAHRPETTGPRQRPPAAGARGQSQAPAEQKGKRKPVKPGQGPDGQH